MVRSCSLLKFVAVLGSLSLAFIFVKPAGAVTVYFEAEGDALRESRLTDRGELIGFVGDLLDLKNGVHEISIRAPKSYALLLSVRADEKDIRVVGTSYLAPNCKPELKVEWPIPQVRAHKRYKDVKVISLPDPRFGAPTGLNRCVMFSMAGCTKRKIILTAQSEPLGAEIWIDDKRLEFRTNTTLSVPYCSGARSKNAMLRIAGKINCQKDIELAPDLHVSINCVFSEPDIDDSE